MAILMEQVADAADWINHRQHSVDGPPDAIPAKALSAAVSALPGVRRHVLLKRIVIAEILPRLAQTRPNPRDSSTDDTLTNDDTAHLVGLLLTQDAAVAVAFINLLQARGATPASLYLGTVTQAARCLGELWDQDRCDFAQVTISMGRLQQVLRSLSPDFQLDAVRRAQTDNILLAPAPGEQHTFGLVMLGEFFKREGWHVAGGPATSARDAADMVRGSWFDVAGFSIGSGTRLDGLAQCIRAVRRASYNSNLYVMVGGPLLLNQPDLVTRVGADAGAIDAVVAVRQARGALQVLESTG